MSIRDEWQTPDDFKDYLTHYCFAEPDVDVAANKYNYWGKCFLKNGLTSDWLVDFKGSESCIAWCNPPYSSPSSWVSKAIEQQSRFGKRLKIFMLLRGDFTTNWFRELENSNQFDFYLLSPRIQFIPPKGVKASTNNGGNILVIGHGNSEISFSRWK